MSGSSTNHSPDPSNRTDRTDSPDSPKPRRLRPSGGYRQLRSFQMATVIYDATVKFCARFVDPRSRTTDQMVQAARSGRQNIAEGSRAAAASSQTELRLVQVARASLDELLLDYEDFLRHRKLRAWGKDDPEAKAVRELGFPHPADSADLTDPADVGDRERWARYAPWLEHADPAEAPAHWHLNLGAPPRGASFQPAVFEVAFFEAEVVAEFVVVGDADFFAEDVFVAFRVVP